MLMIPPGGLQTQNHQLPEEFLSNFFDLQLSGDCYPNRLGLTRHEIAANVERIAAGNGIARGEATVCLEPDYCVEMETGTGKTLVYLRTIYELCREYGFTKFIILVPSMPSLKGGTAFYTPDFGVVISQKDIRDDAEIELHLVVETKSTDNLEDLSQEEQVKIRCAIRHFHALGFSANTTLLYKAPVTRFDANAREDPPDDDASPGGFFAPQTTFATTLQQATSSGPAR
jgi:restriction endonuclease